MDGPRRIRLRRTRGWRKPAEAVRRHRAWFLDRPDLVGRTRRELRGRDLACWCPEDGPCHADTRLEIANDRR